MRIAHAAVAVVILAGAQAMLASGGSPLGTRAEVSQTETGHSRICHRATDTALHARTQAHGEVGAHVDAFGAKVTVADKPGYDLATWKEDEAAAPVVTT
jgi:hypothetical protein